MRAWILVASALAAIGSGARAQSVPPGFVVEHLVGEPFGGQIVGFAHLPDGRALLIERQTGVVRIALPGAATSTSILTIPNVVADFGERGLLGVTVDPAWPARPYVYFYYTAPAACHVTMYEATGDLDDAGSPALALANPFHLLTDIPDVNEIHNAGTVRFGPDGMLYVSVGDDAFSCQPQALTSLLGKLLRLDVSSMPGVGTGPPPKSDLAPPDNPFPGPNENERLVYAWGLRNPYRFTIDAPTGDVFIGCVGSAYYEEINFVPGSDYLGNNYGWPQWEGPQEIHCCGDCGEGNVFTDAIHVYAHIDEITAIIGGARVREVVGSPVGFPSTYDGDYFYLEIYSGKLYRIRETAGAWSHAPAVPGQPDSLAWGTGFFGAADIQQGADGALYLASLGFNAAFPRGLHRVRRVDATAAPNSMAAQRALAVIPNPSREGFRFELPPVEAGVELVEIFDARGRRVRSMTVGTGSVSFGWDGRDGDGVRAPGGVYFVRLRASTGEWNARVVLLPE